MTLVIIAIIAGAALVCPLTMFGPALLRRCGLMKGTSGDMSCMGMMQGRRYAGDQQLDVLHTRRAEVDRAIAQLASQLSEPAQPLSVSASSSSADGVQTVSRREAR